MLMYVEFVLYVLFAMDLNKLYLKLCVCVYIYIYIHTYIHIVCFVCYGSE